MLDISFQKFAGFLIAAPAEEIGFANGLGIQLCIVEIGRYSQRQVQTRDQEDVQKTTHNVPTKLQNNYLSNNDLHRDGHAESFDAPGITE